MIRPDPAVEESEHTAITVLSSVRDAGIVLDLTESKDGILAGPKQRLTDDLRNAIRENSDGVIRHLLFAEAVDHYQRTVRDNGDSMDSAAALQGKRVLAAGEEDLNESWLDSDLEGFRNTLRQWLKTGLAAYRDCRNQPRPAPSEAAPTSGYDSSTTGAQITLMQAAASS